MPQFVAGESKTAVIELSNPTSGSFDYVGTLFLGVGAVVQSVQSFHLNAGEAKNISFPITMPSVAGVYPVFLRVTSGVLDRLYTGGDVTIVQVAPTRIYLGPLAEGQPDVYVIGVNGIPFSGVAGNVGTLAYPITANKIPQITLNLEVLQWETTIILPDGTPFIIHFDNPRIQLTYKPHLRPGEEPGYFARIGGSLGYRDIVIGFRNVPGSYSVGPYDGEFDLMGDSYAPPVGGGIIYRRRFTIMGLLNCTGTGEADSY